MSTELAIELGQRAEHCDARIKLEVDRVAKLGQVDTSLCARLREVDTQAAQDREKVLQDALDACSGRPWWETPAFVAAVTAVATTAAIVGVWWLAVQTVKATA